TDRRRDVLVAGRPERGRQELQAHPAAHVTADRQDPAARGLDADDDVAMRAHADPDIPPPFRDRAIGAAARAAHQVARLERPLADVVRDEGRGGRGMVARFDRLINVDVMGDVTPEALLAAEPALAHDPRDERRRPRIAPPRSDAFRAVPVRVLPFQYPRAV